MQLETAFLARPGTQGYEWRLLAEGFAELAALFVVWRDGLVPAPLDWHPREVLQLCQWAEGVDVDHHERAFCCAVLCLGALGDEGASDGIESTLAMLLESCLVLGPEASTRLPGFLVALLEANRAFDTEELAFCTLALLLVTTQLDAADARLEPLAARLLALESELAAGERYPHPEHGFVLGATFFDQRMELWRRLVRATFAGRTVDTTRPALAQVSQRLL